MSEGGRTDDLSELKTPLWANAFLVLLALGFVGTTWGLGQDLQILRDTGLFLTWLSLNFLSACFLVEWIRRSKSGVTLLPGERLVAGLFLGAGANFLPARLVGLPSLSQALIVVLIAAAASALALAFVKDLLLRSGRIGSVREQQSARKLPVWLFPFSVFGALLVMGYIFADQLPLPRV